MGPSCHVLLLSQDSKWADWALTGRELIFIFLIKEIKWVASRSLIEVHKWSMSCLGKSHQLGIVCTSTACVVKWLNWQDHDIPELLSFRGEKIWRQILGTMWDTVISGIIATLECTEWPYFECINSKLITTRLLHIDKPQVSPAHELHQRFPSHPPLCSQASLNMPNEPWHNSVQLNTTGW